jgi:thiamine-phosphate pyrophosphorylase
MDVRTLRLIAITDDLRDGPFGLLARAQSAVRGGATMVQVRLKAVEPRALVEVARVLVQGLEVPVIINDRVDVALAAGAAGVHLGADDLAPEVARRIVPAGFIIGASVGDETEVADAKAADYVGIGPVYFTDSKGDAGPAIGLARFNRLMTLCQRPAVGIGGIAPETAKGVIEAGAAGVAVIRAVIGAPDPEGAARALRSAMGDNAEAAR